jgi:hypothetical protein
MLGFSDSYLNPLALKVFSSTDTDNPAQEWLASGIELFTPEVAPPPQKGGVHDHPSIGASIGPS